MALHMFRAIDEPWNHSASMTLIPETIRADWFTMVFF